MLVYPKARTDPEWGGDLGAIAEPLALEYIAAVADRRGHEVRILDLRLHPLDLDGTLVEFCPDVVGVTAYSMHVSAAKLVAERAKTLVSDCKTVVGGHHATLLPEDFFVPQVDFVVCGEGTEPFGAILAMLETGGQRRIAGVFQQDNGRFESGGEPANFDLDAIPLPARRFTAADREQYFIDWMKPVALLRSSVGCPYRCSYCSLWKLMGGRYHLRKVESVVEELKTIKEDFVFLVDDEAFINRKRMIELASAISAAGIRKRFFSYCRIDTLLKNRDAVKAWRDIGLERLLIGIDAVTPQELAEYMKACSVAQIEDGMRAADELGIEIFAQFVVNPLYSKEDFVRLRRFVEHRRLRYPSFTILTPLPGTELLADFSAVTELASNGRPNWDLFDTQNAVTRTRMSPEQFRHEYRNLYKIFKGSYAEFKKFHTMTVTNVNTHGVAATT